MVWRPGSLSHFPTQDVVVDRRVYIDTNDLWVGIYRGPHHWYVCPLPCVVIRFRNKKARANLRQAKAGWPGGIDHG